MPSSIAVSRQVVSPDEHRLGYTGDHAKYFHRFPSRHMFHHTATRASVGNRRSLKRNHCTSRQDAHDAVLALSRAGPSPLNVNSGASRPPCDGHEPAAPAFPRLRLGGRQRFTGKLGGPFGVRTSGTYAALQCFPARHKWQLDTSGGRGQNTPITRTPVAAAGHRKILPRAHDREPFLLA